MSVMNKFTLSGGWYQINGEGIGTTYLCIVDEGVTTGPGDTPANAQFRPRILNPDTFSIKRAPVMWVFGDTTIQQAAFSQLEIDNYDGAFNFLISADVRDSVVVMKIFPAKMLTTTDVASAPTIATMLIDSVTTNDQKKITVTFKDTIARLDKTLPCRFNPPFAAEGAANTMIPLLFGAGRNLPAQLVDQPNRIYLIHDAPVANLASVCDRAAPLDPNANPPQYTPARSNSGFALETEAVNFPNGIVTCDACTFGTSTVISAINDVLAGDGAFAGTWTGTPAVPPNFTWTNGAGSSISEVLHANALFLPTGCNAAHISSIIGWRVQWGIANYGDRLETAAVLQPGVPYRVSFGVYSIGNRAPTNNGMQGGLMVCIPPSSGIGAAVPSDYLSGYGQPIVNSPLGTVQNFSYEFTVPVGGSNRKLAFIATPSLDGLTGTPIGSGSANIFDVRIEKLGQYTQLPLTGIPGDALITEILVNRAGESSSVFNASEAASLLLRPDGTLIPIGLFFTEPPNILDAIRIFTDSRYAVTFTDNLGTLRFRQFRDPSDPANTAAVIADFDLTNVDMPVEAQALRVDNLTTLAGARPNGRVFGASDMVTDQAIVPLDIRTRFMRKSQFQVTSSFIPAGEYSHAIGAKIFDTVHDLASDTQDMIDAVVGIFSPQVYSDGTIGTGKRQVVRFTAHFDDVATIGVNTTCAVTDIMYASMVKLTAKNADGSAWLTAKVCEVVDWEIFPFAQKIVIGVVL